MSEEEYQKSLERNIKLFNIFKITTKRVFFPLIAVYLVAVGNVSLFELGIIASAGAIASLVTELPSGYLADRFSKKWSVFLGSIFAALSAGVYLFEPNLIIGIIAAVAFSISMSLSQGALQALIYDTLQDLGRKESYSKTMGYGQSYGLVGNVFLLSLIPLTYSIDPKLPFAIGVFMHLIGCWCIYKMIVPKVSEAHEHLPLRKIFSSMKDGSFGINLSKLVALCIVFGLIGASLKAGIYRSILLTDLGINPEFLGLLVAGGSLFAAIVARYVHYFDRFNLFQIQIISALIVFLTYIFVGLSFLPLVAVITFIFYDMYMRNESILVESAIFRTFPNIKNKSTLLSALKTSEHIFGFITPVVLATLVVSNGIQLGHLLYGVVFIIVFYILYLSLKNKYLLDDR